MTSTHRTLTRLLSPLRLALCASLSLGLVACVGGEKETDSAADSESSATESGSSTSDTSSSSASSTGGTDSSSDGSSGTDSDSAGGTSTTDDVDTSSSGDATSTGEGTTGMADPGLEAACGDACEVLVGCYPDEWESVEACAQECADPFNTPNEACELAAIDYLDCLGGLTCPELEEGACDAEESAAMEACEGEVCSVGVGGGEGTCGIIEECAEGTREMSCAEKSCVCLVDGEAVGECENDVCLDIEPDPEAIHEKALSCCGFEI
ncbi:MAG: hypothetical protein R3A79_00750 [Nannocystaceae bacterium]